MRFHAKDKHGFESSGFNSFDSAQKSIEDSDELIALGKKDPSELTNEQLARFNALMKAHPDDPVFAERVALGLGPEGTLKFFMRRREPGQLGEPRRRWHRHTGGSRGAHATARHAGEAAGHHAGHRLPFEQ